MAEDDKPGALVQTGSFNWKPVDNLRPNPNWVKGVSGNPLGAKKRLLRRMEDILHLKGICPVTEVLKLIPDLNPHAQLKAWLEIIGYLYAKPKEAPISEIEETALNYQALPTKDLLELAKAKIAEIEKKVG